MSELLLITDGRACWGTRLGLRIRLLETERPELGAPPFRNKQSNSWMTDLNMFPGDLACFKVTLGIRWSRLNHEGTLASLSTAGLSYDPRKVGSHAS